ncbi:MAG: DUF3450 domain-containing protein, partial [Desulfobacterota bacterium]|nr:DUF3450 domain-containing protein [Thermodesulfobacteriota bacterium]
LCPITISASEQPEKIISTIDSTIQKRQETQKKTADWNAQKERLKTRYVQVQEDLDLLSVEQQHLQEIVAKQDAYIERTNRKVLEMEKIRQQLVPYLNEVIARMEETIAADLPFLLQERHNRIATLKDIVQDPEVPLSEKLRRVFEGLRVEMDYGKSVETTREEINWQGQRRMVQVLRIGRTALLMQSLDEKDIGMFDGKAWIPVPEKYRGEIKKGLEITQRRRPVDFINLPLRGVAQ